MNIDSNLQVSSKQELKAIFMCAIQVEFIEIRNMLGNTKEITHPMGNVYEEAEFQSDQACWKILIVETGMGNSAAAIQTERAIEFYDPNVVFFIGIAGGLKDVNLGDVVAASSVYGYEKGKSGDEFLQRPLVKPGHFVLIERAKAEARERTQRWSNRIKAEPKPKAFVAPIAAGEKVLVSQSNAVYELLKKNFSDALAVEMEGAGFYEAIDFCGGRHIGFLLIRGISDLLSNKGQTDSAGWQEKAAHNATAFALEILNNLDTVSLFIDSPKADEVKLLNFKNANLQLNKPDWKSELNEVKEKLLRSKIKLSEALLLIYSTTKQHLPQKSVDWIRKEYQGYDKSDISTEDHDLNPDFPEYRRPIAQLLISSPRGLEPVNFEEPETQEIFTKRPINLSISSIEELLDTVGPTIEMSLAPEAEHRLREAITKTDRRLHGDFIADNRKNWINPILYYSRGSFINILNLVRTHLIDLIDEATDSGLSREQKEILIKARKEDRRILINETHGGTTLLIGQQHFDNDGGDRYMVALLGLTQKWNYFAKKILPSGTELYEMTYDGVLKADSLINLEG